MYSQRVLVQTPVQRLHPLPYLRPQFPNRVQQHKLQLCNSPQPLRRFRLYQLPLRSQWQTHIISVVLQHRHHLRPVCMKRPPEAAVVVQTVATRQASAAQQAPAAQHAGIATGPPPQATQVYRIDNNVMPAPCFAQ